MAQGYCLCLYTCTTSDSKDQKQYIIFFFNENMKLCIMYFLCINDTYELQGIKTIVYILLGLKQYILSHSFFEPCIFGGQLPDNRAT